MLLKEEPESQKKLFSISELRSAIIDNQSKIPRRKKSSVSKPESLGKPETCINSKTHNNMILITYN